MTIFKIFILAIIQGLCELLPVSSSAHVILAEKLMGLDPTAPEMTLLLVMLHTGTMFAVIAYFWHAWKQRYFKSASAFWSFARLLAIATALTGVIGFALLRLIERVILAGSAHAEVEQLFGNTYLIGTGLAAVGVMIILSARQPARSSGHRQLSVDSATWIGAIQGLCLPFRGFSRSGATISTGLLLGLNRQRVEEFSFALAVILTPAVILREGYRLFKTHAEMTDSSASLMSFVWPSLAGMAFSFVAGLVALCWLSRWLENDRWGVFGYYCCAVAVVLFSTGVLLR